MEQVSKSASFDYPEEAASVRDLLRTLLMPEVDAGSSMDGGGGNGSADLWVKLGGREYFISVSSIDGVE